MIIVVVVIHQLLEKLPEFIKMILYMLASIMRLEKCLIFLDAIQIT